MSEESFLIHRAEDGEISATFSPIKLSLKDTDDTDHVGSESHENVPEAVDHAQEFQLANDSDLDSGNKLSDENKLDNEINKLGNNDDEENLSKTQDTGTRNSESGIENGSQSSNSVIPDFGRPASTSTPVSRRAMSASESDMAPLLKNTSSVLDSCIGMEGENDDLSEVSCTCSYKAERKCPEHGSLDNLINEPTVERKESLMMPGLIRVPIVGHETMEARSKFTVFKIHVMVEDDDVGWFIFRRYSDFVNLNDQLRFLFPNFRLALPPKRWFRSNFDQEFLEERQLGLQAFVDNVTGHRDICQSQPVREFFCFDEPPGPHDSLEESRAQCECMEELVYLLRKELSDKESEMELLRDELELYKNQVQLLTSRLSELNRLSGLEKQGSDKRLNSSSTGQFDIDALFGAGEKLLTDKGQCFLRSIHGSCLSGRTVTLAVDNQTLILTWASQEMCIDCLSKKNNVKPHYKGS